MKHMSTIRKIAKIAGVSPSTVSRVLTGHANVRLETRNRIIQALNDTNYQSPKTVEKKALCVGIIMPLSCRNLEIRRRKHREFDGTFPKRGMSPNGMNETRAFLCDQATCNKYSLRPGSIELMSVTIRDVAVRSGVSIATVSRVVNHTGYPVSQELQEKILNSIKELNYIPNRSARALKTNKGRGIALIVRKISDPYYCGIADGVTETAIKHASLDGGLPAFPAGELLEKLPAELQGGAGVLGHVGQARAAAIASESRKVNIWRAGQSFGGRGGRCSPRE